MKTLGFQQPLTFDQWMHLFLPGAGLFRADLHTAPFIRQALHLRCFQATQFQTNCIENPLHVEARVVSGQGIHSSEVLWGHRPRTCVA